MGGNGSVVRDFAQQTKVFRLALRAGKPLHRSSTRFSQTIIGWLRCNDDADSRSTFATDCARFWHQVRRRESEKQRLAKLREIHSVALPAAKTLVFVPVAGQSLPSVVLFDRGNALWR